MPKYKVPAEPDYGAPAEVGTNRRKKKRQPTVYIHVDPKWLAKMKVGQKASFQISGEIVGIHMDDDEHSKRSEIRLALSEVEHYGKNRYEEVFDDDGSED